MTNTFLWWLSFIFLVFAASFIILFHKLRRIHVMLYQVANNVSTTRQETEALFGQLQALQSLDRALALPKGLPPLRGWAGSPDMLLVVAQHVLSMRPVSVVECSSGVSTLVIARCLQLNGAGHVFSLEHEPEYSEKTRAMLKEYGLSAWATVVDAPLVPQPDGTLWYECRKLPDETPPFEFLLVDGPPAGAASTARFPALSRLKSRLSNKFTVMLDDADRPGERMVVDKWIQDDPNLRLIRPPCEKGLAVLSK